MPLFSLDLDAPPPRDAAVARVLVQRSQQRYAHPVGMVDAARNAFLERQRTAIPTKLVAEEDPSASTPTGTGQHTSGTGPRKKRRGRGGKAAETSPSAPTQQAHLMYPEEEDHATSDPHA